MVSGGEFLGRASILKKLNTLIELDQSAVLIAPRRFGKTSLIEKLIEEKKSRYKIIYIDLMDIYNKRQLAEQIISAVYGLMGIYGIIAKLKDVSMELLRDITNHLAGMKITIDDIEIMATEKLLKEKDEDLLLAYALDLPEKIAARLGFEILFAIDEFGEMKKFPGHGELLGRMRSKFQRFENVRFIFAGSQYSIMTEIFVKENAAFHKFAEVVPVPPMRAEDFDVYFTRLFRSKEIALHDAFAEDVERLSCGIPYYMVRIARQVLINAVLGERMNVHCFSVRRAAVEVYRNERSYVLSEMNKLKGKKYHVVVLKAIAKGQSYYEVLKAEHGVVRQNANKVANALIDEGFVAKSGTTLNIIDPMIERYVKKEI